MALRNFEDAGAMDAFFFQDREGFVQHQFIRRRETDDENGQSDQTPSDVGLFEPVSIDEESQVTTLEADERGQPGGETSAADEKIIEKFAEEIIENWTRSRDGNHQR